MTWPLFRSTIVGSSPDHEADGGEVVELPSAARSRGTGPGVPHLATDRQAGVVDQDVDVAVRVEHLVDQRVDLRRSRSGRRGRRVRRLPGGDLAAYLVEQVLAARDEQHGAPAPASWTAAARSDT